MDIEQKVFLRHLMKKPGYWAPFSALAGRSALGKINQKFFDGKYGSFIRYPKTIKDYVLNVDWPSHAGKSWCSSLPPIGWTQGNGPLLEEIEIPLAQSFFRLENGRLNWQANFKDIEDVFSLHRFGWLLRWLAAGPPEAGLKTADSLALEWASNHKGPSGMDAYSISERVVNWLTYFSATRAGERLSQLEADILGRSIARQIKKLAFSLEYKGEHTNNHILNNARALYIAGRLAGMEQAAELGRMIFVDQTRRMIDPEGFLREASSHYQFLLTRTYMETAAIAGMTGDEAFATIMRSISNTMLAACNDLFSEKNGNIFPVIGDVSPDFPKNWFLPGRECGWSSIWKDEARLFKGKKSREAKNILDGGGWIVLRKGDWSVYARKLGKGSPYPGTHGHSDFGSFSIYHGKQPIFIDCGRVAYTDDSWSHYGVSPGAHNTLTINGMEPVPVAKGILRHYMEVASIKFDTTVFEDEHNIKIRWSSNGFSRFGEQILWERCLSCVGNIVVIEDSLTSEGKPKKMLEIRFHLHPSITPVRNDKRMDLMGTDKEKFSFCVDKDGEEMIPEIRGGKANPDDGGWWFPDYGKKESCATLVNKILIEEQAKIQYRLEHT